MKYINLIYEHADNMGKLSDDGFEELVRQHRELQLKSKNDQAFKSSNQLAPLNKAVSVRVRNGESIITDGPFTEAKELFVGYYVFECEDLEAVLQWAKMIPTEANGGVEIRPLDMLSSTTQIIESEKSFQVKPNNALFSLLIYQPEVLLDSMTATQEQELIQGNTTLAKRVRNNGEYVTGVKLMPPVTATSVRENLSPEQITDGPFTEAKEVLIGLHVIACPTIGDAIEIAEDIPDVQTGVVEIRPVRYYEQLGDEALTWTNSALF